jgi:hypothetical protein
MKILKALLIVVAVIVAGMIGMSLLGLIYSGVWYLLVAGVLGLGGYTAYKFIKATNAPQLEEKPPFSEIDYNEDVLNKQLEEFKQKLLK